MQNIRHCLRCSRLFGFRVTPYLNGSSEGQAFEEGDNVVLPVSLGTSLILIGGQLTGFANPEIQELITASCGLNIKEFFQSGLCPLCFPSPDDEDEDWDDDEDDDDWDDDDDWVDDGEENVKPVTVLQVPANGPVRSLVVRGLTDMKKQSGITGDFDSWYLRDLGVYYWYDRDAVEKDLPFNAYCSVLSGSYVQGTVMIIGDLKKDLSRSSDWQNLPEGWLNPRLAEVISLVNSDQRVAALLKQAFRK